MVDSGKGGLPNYPSLLGTRLYPSPPQKIQAFL
ncbi:hypothetical protein PPTG_21439 [Phytophthora nicotianae INRA-310]|uniref:Uncharacterized protein n=1 Tax=Phytophthora nicotianae (strain INRA-310) TaxID=761204 RepID=W2R3F0_PHYN3|nr:hypothetical protein PPTG_21439 [Phytophthora nicotianae INRA-310]ETN19234.1 hypothetical protein PPTG_21439 [Phytophthora nicotianae INRA-310]